MLSTVEVVKFSGVGNITFYVSVETNSFDYELMTRECAVKLHAFTNVNGSVLKSADAESTFSIFGKTFVLPQEITTVA